MDSTEFEKDSAPSLIEFLEENDIKAVAFDIDNTVLDTNLLFHETLYELGIEIALALPFEVSPPCYEEITRQLESAVYDVYYRDKKKPKLIGEQMREALSCFLKELQIKEVTPMMDEIIDWYEERHYSLSPIPFKDVGQLLELIHNSKRNIVFNSHAQEDWTEQKVTVLSNLFDNSPTFQYLAVPIEEEKDPDSWKTAYEMVKTNPENVLTVGDNFNSDIQSAMNAGCKHLVWIDRRGEKIPEDFVLKEDAHLYIIKNITELKDIADEKRYIM